MIRELRTIDPTGISEEEREDAWNIIIFFDKLVTNTSGDRSGSLNGKLRRILQAAEDGDWLALASELMDDAGSEKDSALETPRVKYSKGKRQGIGEKGASMCSRRILAKGNRGHQERRFEAKISSKGLGIYLNGVAR